MKVPEKIVPLLPELVAFAIGSVSFGVGVVWAFGWPPLLIVVGLVLLLGSTLI
jgi:hypothetical protein